MATLKTVIQLSEKAHENQVDKAGQPYILHPIRVMLRVTTEAARITAVLHDVVEDTEIALDNLVQAGFSTEILEAVDALTKRKGETRLEAAARAANNPIARTVKLADNTENMDLSRIERPTDKDFARIEEYKAVRELLLSTNKPIE